MKKQKKLGIKKITLRNLEDQQLQAVNGGATTKSTCPSTCAETCYKTCTCPTKGCPTLFGDCPQ